MKRLILLSVLSGLVACVEPPAAPGAPVVTDEEFAEDDASATGYFLARRDFRRCAYPFCGGFWVRRANQAQTACPGGNGSADECYVVEIDASSIGSDINVSEFEVVRGRFSTRRVNGNRMGFLNASELWSAATDVAATGTFYSLEDNGLTCITTPCFNLEGQRLNSSARPTALSELDLRGAGATAAQEQAAREALIEGRLIAAGAVANVNNAGPAGRGRALNASQFYLQYEHDENACTSDDQCGWSGFVRPVTSSADCYCPGCPEPMANSVSDANQASWGQFCGHIRCAGPRCAPLTLPICVPQGAQGVCGAE